ncbi:hypothetical protein FB45DRAFT_912876 [Roridomyces roridus]|uniref:Uncharacterized protein n=1 Tax=Roridomyces roridus TaxID=1738132 RepID=A0AAD7BWU5_9AGAR|nr:hypothetical protein FB45DRAFT_912876 [Roridomyces roridus]
MCHNIIDGRRHKLCGHFVALATRRQDCRRVDCLFSERHMHMGQCRSASCLRLMSPPTFNPIRESPTRCPQCVMAKTGYPVLPNI